MALTVANDAATAAVDAITALLNDGYLRIYSGTRPTNPDAALTGNTLLAELRFGNPAFGSGANGVATANLITSDTAADATGTATFYRAFQGNGTSPVIDGTAGGPGSGADLIINNPNIQANTQVSVFSFVLTEPRGG